MTGFGEQENYCLKVLEELGKHPAISFMEDSVAGAVTNALDEMGLSWYPDSYGNIISTLSGPDSANVDTPPIAFVAHMDHPGFEVTEKKGSSFVAKALGGVPSSCFSPGIPLRIIAPDGRILKATTLGRSDAEAQRSILIQLHDHQPLKLPAAAVLELPDFSITGDRIHMRAADDLAGCSIILAALNLISLDTGSDNRGVGHVYGIFTRAEEVGLVGARLLAESGNLPKNTLIELSREM